MELRSELGIHSRRKPMHSMAATGVIVVIRINSRILLATIVLTLVLYLIARRTSYLPADSIRPKSSALSKANQSRALQFVSLCSSNLDGRRLGNQLFNWAAILYVARLTGRPPLYIIYRLHSTYISIFCII